MGSERTLVASLYLAAGAPGDFSSRWSFPQALCKPHSFEDKHRSENSRQTASGSGRLLQTGLVRTVSGHSVASIKNNSSMLLLNKARILLNREKFLKLVYEEKRV